MDATLLGVVFTAFPSALAGAAAIITAVNNKRTKADEMQKDIKTIKEGIKRCKEDIALTKEASFYSLEAHVENGANGNVKKAYNRLKGSVFYGNVK